MTMPGDSLKGKDSRGAEPPVYHAWDARLMGRRRAAELQLATFLGLLWFPVCVALVPCCILLIMFHTYLSHFINDNRIPLLDMEQFDTWAWVVHTVLFTIETVLATLVLTVFFRKLVFLLARWRVRLVTSRLYLSDLPLMIADQCYREAEVIESGKVKAVLRGRLESFEQVVDEVVRNNDRAWQRAGKDETAVRRVSGDGLAGSRMDKAVILVTLALVLLVLPFFAGTEFVLIAVPLLLALILPSAWFNRAVLRRATEIAVCDFLVENLRSEYYHGWSMPVRVK